MYGSFIEIYLKIADCRNANEFQLIIDELTSIVNSNDISISSEKRKAKRILENVDRFRDETSLLEILHSRIEVEKLH